MRWGELWAKHKGQKCGAIGNTLGEHIENLRNFIGNMVGAQKFKNSTPTPEPSRVHVQACHCMQILFLKLVVTIFGLNLIPVPVEHGRLFV